MRQADKRPNVRRWEDTEADWFEGTKADLVASGVCKAAWFPAKLKPEIRKDGKPSGRLIRRYHVEGGVILRHKLDAHKVELWRVSIPVHGKEKQKREAKAEQESAEREALWARNRQAAAETAPTLVPLRLATHTFKVGDRVILHVPGGYSHGEEAVISRPFAIYDVTDCGERWGYVVKFPDGDEVFYPACNLRETASRQAYIRRVK